MGWLRDWLENLVMHWPQDGSDVRVPNESKAGEFLRDHGFISASPCKGGILLPKSRAVVLLRFADQLQNNAECRACSVETASLSTPSSPSGSVRCRDGIVPCTAARRDFGEYPSVGCQKNYK